jgi:GT2 family glycosyltransferase
MKNKIELSIIIVSFNTEKLTTEVIASIEKQYQNEVGNGLFEIIVSDNGSSDHTIHTLQEYKKRTKIKLLTILDNKENAGFSKANNIGVKKAKGRFLLFLNPDTIVYRDTLTYLINFMDSHKDAGAVTCKLEIPGGGVDEASHRGFPTPWNALCHFSGIEKIFPKSRLFSGYIQGWKDLHTIHTIDACVGAFLFVRREAGDDIGWWDEDYFFYGEDLDFCFMLKEKGWNIYYVPHVAILHYGGVASGIKKHSQHLTTADMKRKIMVQNARFDAMRIFYEKHYKKKYPTILSWLVLKGINFLHRRQLNVYSKKNV